MSIELGQHKGEIQQGKSLADAAKLIGVKHFIQSTMADGLNPAPEKLHHFRSKHDIEEYVAKIGLPYTFLGTVTFMDNFLDPKLGGKWTFPFISSVMRPDSKYHMLASDDIGGVVTGLLASNESYIGRKINLVSDCPTLEEMRQTYKEVTNKSAKSLTIPLWLAKLLNSEFVEQLEWQREGNWTFSNQQAKNIYPKMTSFKEFLLKNRITNL